MKPFALKILLGMLAFTCAQAASPLDSSAVMALVKTHGAHEAANRIWGSEQYTRQFLAGVRSGDPDWLRAAEAVTPGTDAGSSEDLDGAFADALLVNPYALLPWLQQHWWGGSSAVCVFGYDSELPGGVSRYLSQLQVSLSKRPPHGLSGLRHQCLRGIEQTRKSLPPSTTAHNISFKADGFAAA
jgi:hypothetical protein